MITGTKRAQFTDPQKEVGYAVTALDYVLFLSGLPSARIHDVVVNERGNVGLITSLDDEKIEVWMLDGARPKPGDAFYLKADGISIPTDGNILGRTINPLGIAVDGKGPVSGSGMPLDMEVVAPGIAARESIVDQFYTGITMIDTLIPIGKGQRELIFGDARSGKSSFLLDIIAQQKGTGCICIYAAIGKSDSDVKRMSERIIELGAGGYTTVLAATSSDGAPLIALAPTVAFSLAEYYVHQGKDVLLILDDLATHARYLREIGLLAGRVPGRESYPADIFYQHSHLIERGGRFRLKNGSVAALTVLPVIETELENFTNLIPTNAMSMTDGHIFFSAAKRAQGMYPAVEYDRSVTRVGRQTQIALLKTVSDKARSLLANYHDLERFSRFGSELTGETQMLLKRGKVIDELLKQELFVNIPHTVQLFLFSLVFVGFFDLRDMEFVKRNKKKIIEVLGTSSAFSQIAGKLQTLDIDNFFREVQKNLSVVEVACQQ